MQRLLKPRSYGSLRHLARPDLPLTRCPLKGNWLVVAADAHGLSC
jgi:hypothetical protein